MKRVLGLAALDGHASQVVALGEDPGDLALDGDEERADVGVYHLPDRVEHGRVGVDLEHVPALLLEDLGDGAHRLILRVGTLICQGGVGGTSLDDTACVSSNPPG